MSDLPDGWTAQTLGSIADCRLGKMLDVEKNKGKLRPYLRNANVQWGTIDLSDIKEMRIADDERERYALLPGDLLVCEGGEPGRCAVWQEDREMYLQKALHRVRPLNGISAEYLRWFFQHAVSSGALENHYTGSTIKHLPGRQLAQIIVPAPPVDEQRRIAVWLEEVDARRASIADRLAAARAIVDRIHMAVLAAACSGRMTADFRANHGSASAAGDQASRAERSNAEEQVPAGWSWLPLGEISDVRGGIQKKPDRAPRSNAWPYLRVANVLRGRLDLSEIAEFELFEGELERYALQRGDLLVVEGNGSLSEIGRAALWHGEIANCVHQNHLIRVRPTTVLPEYLELYWNSRTASRAIAALAVTTAGLYNLSVGKIARVPVPVPPLDEQHEIVRCATAALEAVDRLKPAILAAEAAVSRSAQGVLATAFRGDLALGRINRASQ